MSHSGSFISEDNRKIFETPGRVVPRSVRRIAETGLERRQLLTDVVLEQLEQLPEFSQNRFRCCCVSVVPDDGMSWSAESVSRAVERAAPTYKRWTVQDAPQRGKLPAIAEIVGERRFVNCAAKWKYTSRFLSLRPWMTWAIVGLSIIFAAVLEVVKELKPEVSASSGSFLSNLWICAYGLAIAVLGFATKVTAEKREIGPKSKSIRELRTRLEEERQSEEFDSFVAELADLLRGGDFPRVVIVDDYDALDETSRQVLKKYLGDDREQENAEAWVVFQSREGERLGSWILDERSQAARKSQVMLFEQQPLTTQEKRELSETLGRDPSAVDSIPVKFVCSSSVEKKKPLHGYFQAWRNDHPAQPDGYGDLEFLYLMSITSVPGDLYVKPSFLSTQIAARKTGVAAEALKQFFRGKRLTAEEFEDRCKSLIKNFSRVLTIAEGDSSLRVFPEGAQVLAEMSDALQLPSRALAHLFWCVLWHDIWESRSVEAFWTRKIILHLIEARASALDKEEYQPGARELLLRINLFAVDAALQTCLFAQEIPLLRRAVRLLKDSSQQALAVEPVLQKAWECYSVLGDSRPEADFAEGKAKEDSEDLGNILRDLVALSREQPRMVAKAGRLRPVLELFVDSLPASGLHGDLKAECLRWFESPGAASARDYATCRTAWLSLTLLPMLSPQGALHLKLVLERSIESMEELLVELPRRLSQPQQAASSRAADLVSLSTAFWCQALAISFPEPWTAVDSNRVNDKLIALAHRATEALQVAQQMRRSRSRLIPQNDLFSRALAREICAVALSSILTACHYQRTLYRHQFSQEAVLEISATFRKTEEALSFPLPRIETVEDLLSHHVTGRVNDLLKLCLLVWARFGLTELHDLLSLRQVHFSTIALELHLDNSASIRHLIESLSSALERRNFTGLMANCILADCFQTAADLSAQSLCRAGDIALQSKLGDELKRCFALVAIERAHAFGTDLDSFLDLLLERDGNGKSFISNYFRECPADQFCGLALRFLNAASNSKTRSLEPQVEQIVSDSAKQMQDGDLRDEIEALLDSRRLSRDFQRGAAVDPDQILARWTNRRGTWLYPTVLRGLLQSGHISEEVRREALGLLDRDAQQDAYNTYYLLAVELGERWPGLAADAVAAGKVGGYIKRGLLTWESQSSAQLNMRAYQTLAPLEMAGEGKYTANIMKWQAVHWEREHLKRLPNMIKQGQVFLVFEQYFEWMNFWGLETDVPGSEFSARWNTPPEIKKRMVEEWHTRGEIVPPVFAKRGNQRVISAEFLIIGTALFRPPLDSQERYDAARSKFNDAAHRSFRDLLRLMGNLPQMPPDFAESLRVHGERLYKYTSPSGDDSLAASVVA